MKTNRFGISPLSLNHIIAALEEFPEITEVYIFGSRAMGNAKKGSDIDLAIRGKQVTFETISKLYVRLNEQLPIPYYIDLIDLQSLDNPSLRQHISENGKLFYSRQPEYEKE